MAKHIFGWSYPPGVTGREPELTGDCGPCECCGALDVDQCVCPRCPECDVFGDSRCYIKRGLAYSMAQLHGQALLEDRERADQMADEQLFAEWLADRRRGHGDPAAG